MAAVTAALLEDDVVAAGPPHVPVALLVIPGTTSPRLGHEADQSILVFAVIEKQ